MGLNSPLCGPTPSPPAECTWSLASGAGQRNHAAADVLLGCLEVAMEDVVQELTGRAG